MRPHVFLDLDVSTTAEAVVLCRAIGDTGVGVRLGPRLLARAGSLGVAATAEFVTVLADARLGGAAREVSAGAAAFASLGASIVTVDGRLDLDALDSCVSATEPYGAVVAAVGHPPFSPPPVGGRGKAVSAAARHLGQTAVAAMVGEPKDIGVVAQVAPHLEVLVAGATNPEDVADWLAKGAAAVIADGGLGRGGDPAAVALLFGAAAAAADTIDAPGE